MLFIFAHHSDTPRLRAAHRSQKLLRVTRISRMLKLIKSFRSLQSLFVTLWISLPAFWNVGALLLLIIFMCVYCIQSLVSCLCYYCKIISCLLLLIPPQLSTSHPFRYSYLGVQLLGHIRHGKALNYHANFECDSHWRISLFEADVS